MIPVACSSGPVIYHRPNIYRSKHLLDDRVREAFNGLVAGRKPWPLFLFGDVGTGKTCAALALLDMTMGQFWDLPDLVETLNAARNGEVRSPDGGYYTSPGDVWETWGTCKVATLDEIGTRTKPTDFQYEVLRRAIDVRLNGRLPLVCVSNMSLEQIARQYDDRVASRMASGTVLEVRGNDRRLDPNRGII